VRSAVIAEARLRKIIPCPNLRQPDAYAAGLKLADLLESGVAKTPREAAQMLVRAAFEQWRSGKSTALHFGLRDAVVTATRDVRRGYVEAAPASAFTGREVSPDELFGPLVESGGRKGGRRG
jgi:hypothetical protein